MATPRRAWFRAAEILAHEPISKEELGVLYSLMAAMNRHWARNGLSQEEAGEILMTKAQMFDVTGRFRLGSARNLLVKLGDTVKITIELQGDNTLVRWPKFPIFQQYPPGMRAESPPRLPSPLPLSASAPASASEEEKNPPSPPAAQGGSRGARRAPGIPFPDPFPDQDQAALEVWALRPKTAGELGSIDVEWAIERVREWAEARGHRRVSWVRAIQGYIRDGWARRPLEQNATQESSHVRNANRILSRITGPEAQVPGGPVLDLPAGERA